MDNWQNIWSKREMKTSQKTLLHKLIATDGFDTGYGTILESDWLEYIAYIAQKLNIDKQSSIYEVGCGAGAFLYPFYEQGNRIGGNDYSKNLIDIAKKHNLQIEIEQQNINNYKNNLYRFNVFIYKD